ncbi:MAG: DUF1559 domain-containing protein [Planctomycetaceae bacterium]|nr:DUF1559 domain-containing protein [Planctomycetaceae bacterium]
MKRTLSFLFLFVCLPVIAQESTDTEPTRITGPLTAEGYIDYFKALEEKMLPPELATDDNGFRIFVRAFGDVDTLFFTQEIYRLQRYEKLGLDPNGSPTMTLPPDPREVIRDFREAQGETVPNWRGINIGERPWTLDEYPMLAEWIKEIDKPMDAIAEMIRKPVFAPPLYQGAKSLETGTPQNLQALLLPDVSGFREIARIFQVRATYRISQGNIDGAIDDKLTLHRFGRLVAPKSCLLQFLVGIAIESMASAIPIHANPEHPLTEQQIRRILEGLDALPPRVPISEVFEWERIAMLSVVQIIQITSDKGERVTDTDIAPILALVRNASRNAPFDWDIVYRRINEIWDAVHEPLPRAKYRSMREESLMPSGRQVALAFLNPDALGTVVGNLLIGLFFPAFEFAEEAGRRAECADNMQRLALAIMLYQLEHGKMPDANWAVQIEKYLGDGAPGDGAERYFSCPSNPTAKGETVYALIQYGDTVPDSRDMLLLVELLEPVPLDKAVITVEEVLARNRTGGSHPAGMNVAHRNGAVRFLSHSVSEVELRQLLGGERI